MPMVRSMLKRLSGRTLNTSLSPDQSIAHGATYYAGMLLTNSAFAKSILNPTAAARLAQFKQRSVSARALGILVRDHETGQRVPHYILPAHTQLPTSVSQIYGTVSENQRKVHLRIVESGTAADTTYVELGTCMIEPLPENLPEATEIEVTIRYDEQARVHVSAKVLATGQEAQTEIIRPENMLVSALNDESDGSEVSVKSDNQPHLAGSKSSDAVPLVSKPVSPNLPAKAVEAAKPIPGPKSRTAKNAHIENSNTPIPLCNQCGEPLDSRGKCSRCESALVKSPRGGQPAKPKQAAGKIVPPAPVKPAVKTQSQKMADEAAYDFLTDDDYLSSGPKASKKAASQKAGHNPAPAVEKSQDSTSSKDMDDSEFWRLLNDQ
jgi:molecular chaperone DnaK